jgi:hypothetical protein
MQKQTSGSIWYDESTQTEFYQIAPIISGFNELVQSVKGIEKQFPNRTFKLFVSFNDLNK